MTWLIIGGAGYIGAHVVEAMRAAGERVVVLDDLSTGTSDRIPDGVPLVEASTRDTDAVRRVLQAHDISGVVHLAAKKMPGESVERPLHYYAENIGGLVSLLEAMTEAGVEVLVYSSSASTYGDQPVDVLTEDLACRPANPYGETKLAGEWLLADVARVRPLRYLALRYFNAAGSARPGLADPAVLNLIQLVFERLTAGEPPRLYGTDYPTADGTTIRDYVHVADLASAHVAAARYLADGEAPDRSGGPVLNVGTGVGTSTRRIIELILEVSGHAADPAFKPIELGRRPGDPAISIASAARIGELLGWAPEHDVHQIVESAWQGWQWRRSRLS